MPATHLKIQPLTHPVYWTKPEKMAPPLPPSFRSLELTGILQTTLDVDELFELFLQELQNYVEVSGLSYRCPEQHLELFRGMITHHSLTCELMIRGQYLGEVIFSLKHPVQSDEKDTLETLLTALLYPLRNALDYKRAVRSALLDSLTGVNNRAALDAMLHREIELATRRGTPLSLALLDVDFFKRINDNYGHPVGDLCLQAIAQCVQITIRSSDLLFRIGGEEFLMIMSQTDLIGAEQLAERVRQAIAHITLNVLRERSLTVSIGVTQWVLGDSIQSLYYRADQALYQAKQHGRNRVIGIHAATVESTL